MGGIIMVASIIIWCLGYYPNHEAYETTAEQQENSYIGQLGKAIEPAIEPLGFDWKMGIGILSGIGAKELVVSTLGVLYTNEDDADTVPRRGEREVGAREADDEDDDAAHGKADQDREDRRCDGLEAFALQEVFFFHTAVSSFAVRLAPAM